VQWPFSRRAPIGCRVLTGHYQDGEARQADQSRSQRSRDPHGDPDTGEPADAIPAAPAHRKPVTHRTAATARRGAGLGAQAKPAHTALDATVAGVRELHPDGPPRR
jgi:hypothetical protein